MAIRYVRDMVGYSRDDEYTPSEQKVLHKKQKYHKVFPLQSKQKFRKALLLPFLLKALKQRKRPQGHPFHLVDPSPWPIFGAAGAFFTAFGFILKVSVADGSLFSGSFLLYWGLIITLSTAFGWWRDVTRESLGEGSMTSSVKRGIRMGMVLFIASEVMFFGSFLCTYTFLAINPVHSLGVMWPPIGVEGFDPLTHPLLNTLILLASGATLTVGHHAVLEGRRSLACKGILMTVALGAWFLFGQYVEYTSGLFHVNDGVYGSVFYILTGFHGAHVFIGFISLIWCGAKVAAYHVTPSAHVIVEIVSWYWHFVDVVWLFVFIMAYWWARQTSYITIIGVL